MIKKQTPWRRRLKWAGFAGMGLLAVGLFLEGRGNTPSYMPLMSKARGELQSESGDYRIIRYDVQSLFGTPIASAQPPEKVDDKGYQPITIDWLSHYDYIIPSYDAISKGEIPDQIPAEIKQLSGQKVVVDGFMIPLEITSKEKIKSFVLLYDQMGCCFGVPPAINGWIHVTMKPGQEAEFLPDIPIQVRGKFDVGEEIEGSAILSLYRLEGESVEAIEIDFSGLNESLGSSGNFGGPERQP